MSMAKAERPDGEYVIKIGRVGSVDLYLSEGTMQRDYPKEPTDEKDVSRVATEAREGWRTIDQDKMRHYFLAGKSLCGSWLIFETGGLEEVNDDHPGNCRTCQGKLKNR